MNHEKLNGCMLAILHILGKNSLLEGSMYPHIVNSSESKVFVKKSLFDTEALSNELNLFVKDCAFVKKESKKEGYWEIQ